MNDSPTGYLDATNENGRLVFERGITGPVAMLNLLRFRRHADYSASPDLAPADSISGRQAYERYMEHTLPYLEERGGSLRFIGEGGHFLIGPLDERWDLVMLVQHQSLEALMDMANDLGYMAGMGHRTAALADSRLLPIVAGAPDEKVQ